jgi:seryl-tRNA synthetase
MREIPKKTIKDTLKDIVKRTVDGVRKFENERSGEIGRAANSAAGAVEKVFKKGSTAATPPKGFTDADYDKMVKGSVFNEHPNQKAHHTKMAMDGKANQIGDHVPNKQKYVDMVKKWKAGEIDKKMGDYVSLKKQPYSGKEIDTGRAITFTGAAGAAVGEQINNAITPEEPKHFMSKEITSQKEANGYWTRQKNGGNK